MFSFGIAFSPLAPVDINDNAPFFPAAVYTGNVTENGTAGMTVMTMTATDYDDPTEGANAKLTYSIEQNQVNENGELIFAIDEETGVISTAVCCLDRETNPEYTIKVRFSNKVSFHTVVILIDSNPHVPNVRSNRFFNP